MTPVHTAIDTPEALDEERLEQAWVKDKEHSRLGAEPHRLEQQKRELRSEVPGYNERPGYDEMPDEDSRLRHDARDESADRPAEAFHQAGHAR